MFISEKTANLLKGIIAHPTRLITKVKIGDIINNKRLELLGKTVSFTKSLNPSDKG
jgi:hypothetical protein